MLVYKQEKIKRQFLFSQIEDAEIQKQLDKLAATKTANKVENAKAEPQNETASIESRITI